MSELGVQPLTVAYVTHVARLLQSKIHGLDLDAAEKWLATMLGFASSTELYLVADLLRSEKTSYERNQVTRVETSAEFQARQLAALAAISQTEAEAIVRWLTVKSWEGSSPASTDAWKRVLEMSFKGRIDTAIDDAIAAFERYPDPVLSSFAHYVVSGALSATRQPPRLTELLRIAADHGDPDHAYNYANLLVDAARTGEDYATALRWYEKAIAECRSPRMRAASLVNSTHIVRDGLAEGEPDWERAVDRYERAGRMGMVVAMFNAGNVAGWIANKGNKDYVARAAYWFQYALDYVSAGKVVLDFNGPDGDNGMDAVLNRCRLALAYIHVNANWPEADPEYGIKLITDLAVAGDEEARETFGKGMARRLLALQRPVSESPSENWRRVLKALNWDVTVGLGGENVSDDDLHVLLREKLGIEVFSVNLATQPGTYMPVVVTDDPYLPVAGGDEILPKLAEMLLKIFPRGCILFTRRAMFRQIDSRMFTRAFVVFSRAPHLREVAISLFGGGPESLLEQAGRGAACGSDSRFADANCAISIAVNTFDDGLSPAEGGRIDSAWIGVGNNWRMPVLRSHGEPADELLARVMEPRPVPRKSSAG